MYSLMTHHFGACNSTNDSLEWGKFIDRMFCQYSKVELKIYFKLYSHLGDEIVIKILKS